MRERVAPYKLPLALTECHFGLPGRNRCEVLSTWAAGVAYAAVMNVHERNGDVLKIATLADFCGTRWQNNAIMIPVPDGRSFMMPVAMAVSLYRRHTGEQGRHGDADSGRPGRHGQPQRRHGVPARGQHAADAPVAARFEVRGTAIARGRVAWFAPEPEFEIFEYRPELTFPQEKDLPPDRALGLPAGIRLGRGTQPAPDVARERGQVQFVRSRAPTEGGSRAVPANWTCPLFPPGGQSNHVACHLPCSRRRDRRAV